MVALAIGAGVAASAASGAMSSSAASSGSKTQARQAAASAASLGRAGESAQNYLNPYVSTGDAALQNEFGDAEYTNNVRSNGYLNQAQGENNQADNLLTNLANGSGITQSTIQNTPGYAAINALGEQGATNSAAARGLANSGAAMKGAADYATTQAEGDYQNLYQDQLGAANALGTSSENFLNQSNTYQNALNSEFNRSNTEAGMGLSAAQSSAENALTAAGASNQYSTSGANALAAGDVSSANALGSSLTNSTNALSQYAMYSQLMNGGSSGF